MSLLQSGQEIKKKQKTIRIKNSSCITLHLTQYCLCVHSVSAATLIDLVKPSTMFPQYSLAFIQLLISPTAYYTFHI